eukprot:jgi/Botrbrau1/17617/Bobra.0166s0053.1
MGCADHVDAARAGHLHCLDQLCKQGHFVRTDNPDWPCAGEARKCQAFEAATAACSSGHTDVIAWLFPSGWPLKLLEIFSWDTQDLLEQHEDFAKAFPDLKLDREPLFFEYKLCCSAVQQATTSCLDALIDVGCRSAWLCRIAAREGKASFLALAAKRGCPCDFWVWEFAIRTSNHAMLKLLETDKAMRSIARMGHNGGGLSWMDRLVHLAVSHDNWEGLQSLMRAGYTDLAGAARMAAASGGLQCLKNLVELDPRLLLEYNLLLEATSSGSLACLEFLHKAGPDDTLSNSVHIFAAGSRSAQTLRYCLSVRPPIRESAYGGAYMDGLMAKAAGSGSSDCMQALYEYGYQTPPGDVLQRLVRRAITSGSVACARLAVQHGGPVQLQIVDLGNAAMGGEEMLKFVHGLGAGMHTIAADWAAYAGQEGALHYALQHGASLTVQSFVVAIKRGSLECLKCAFEHGLVAGFPPGFHEPESPFLGHAWVTPCLQVLRYVCKVMRPAWIPHFLNLVAVSLAASKLEGLKDAWKMCLYMAPRMMAGCPLPPVLDKLVQARRERARALARVIYKAKKQAQAEDSSPLLAMWSSMGRLPGEVLERIAFEAHLVCPEALLEPL